MNSSASLNEELHQVCTKTVMDTTDPDIYFDKDGVCNYWHEFQAFEKSLPSPAERDRRLQDTLARIKTAGKGRPYDSVVGLSGGVDSSYLAWLTKEWGLRPLAVHFDNGWNSELAVNNIQMLIGKLGYDLETFVMDWDEFRDLQRAYFMASVIDLEVPTDHMIFGALHKIAADHGIKYILSGTNYQTEWLLPRKWYYPKGDLTNLKSIHRAFGNKPLRKLPAIGIWQTIYYQQVRGITIVSPLDLVNYQKAQAKEILIADLGWRDYGGKHHESIFTRFYQGYILPKKFFVDKRKAHLSSLILAGQITRTEALCELQQPTYDENQQLQDKAYVAKKLGFSDKDFELVLTQPNRRHEEFGTDANQRARLRQVLNVTGPMRRLLRAPFLA